MSAKISVLFFAFMVILVASENCNLVLNEVNTGSPDRFRKKDFIELKMLCDPDTSTPKIKHLQGYKIIGISAGADTSGQKQQMTIDLIISLWNCQINERNMFTIGADGVPNTDMNTKSQFVTYRNKYSQNTQTLSSFLNKGDKHIHAIALLYKKSNNFPELMLNAKKPFIIIDEKLQELIKSNLIDLIVYARKAPYENCHLFTNFVDEYDKKDYILREFDSHKEPSIDRTLNRCAFDRSTFIPEKFKLGKPTPGDENDCSGVNFLLEKHLSKLTNTPFNKAFDDDNIETIDQILESSESPQCVSSFDASVFANVPDDAIEEEIQKEIQAASTNQCSYLNLGPEDGNIADELDNLNRRKRKLSETAKYEEVNEWESTSHFQ